MKPEKLKAKIERVRSEMVSVGMREGLSNPLTVKLSQKLDKLLNQLERQKKRGETKNVRIIKCAG